MANTLEEITAQIKERLDIVDVVSRQVVLKKSGGRYWGLCPFHKEKTPSFSVNPRLGIYKCFGCGEGGDSLSFIMKTENKEFMDVIKEYAEKFGLELPSNFQKRDKSLKDEMLKACSKAAQYYNLILTKDKESAPVPEYLNNRGISGDIIEKFRLGLAPKSYTGFYDKFKNEFSDEALEKAGLILQGKNGYIDRFRNRIIIPILNEFGEVTAFGARSVEDGQNPKYLNSSDSIIYNKSKTLYGLYTAKEKIKEEDCVIIMEGYFDVISAQAHGIENCVAACGTSLTFDHIKLLSRYTQSRKIYLSFDTDSAGLKATDRNAGLIKEAFAGLGNIKQFDESYISASDDKYACEIRVIAPPEGKDPDEFIRHAGVESYKHYMAHAPLLIDFQINNLLKEKNLIKTPQDKTKLVKKLIPVLHEIRNEIVLSEYTRMVSAALDLDETALLNEIRKMKEDISPNESHSVSRIVTKNSPVTEKAQKNLLSLFMVTAGPFSYGKIKEMIDNTVFTEKRLINVKNTIDKLTDTVNNVKDLVEQLYTNYVQDQEIQAIITELISISETFDNLNDKDFQTVIRENIQRINQCQKEEEYNRVRDMYRNVNNDDKEALKIQMQLRDKIDNLLESEKINE
ncbi:MAG: DNA primase [Heliobacteriaceae bacterium]|jgi:DNA primase|nr:DNA primase [Heliobacteriaceae bacterium]